VILVHNYPSGKVEPSREDRAVTTRLVEAGETMGIEVLDHVIIGETHFSFKEHGFI
jgi:DNA repair protein RadC